MNKETIITSAFRVHRSEFSRSLRPCGLERSSHSSKGLRTLGLEVLRDTELNQGIRARREQMGHINSQERVGKERRHDPYPGPYVHSSPPVARLAQQKNTPAGCSKRPSSKAAASEQLNSER